MFLSITDTTLRQLVSTTTTQPTTTAKAETHVCVFQDSDTCALSDQTVCTQVHLATCSKLETAPYPLFAMLRKYELHGQTVFDISFHLDATCSLSLLGAVEQKAAIAPDVCSGLSIASVSRAFGVLLNFFLPLYIFIIDREHCTLPS